MDVTEIRNEKEKLENEINELVMDFEKKSDVVIYEILKCDKEYIKGLQKETTRIIISLKPIN
jgi:hypothetical protein